MERGLKRLRDKYAGRRLTARPPSIDDQKWAIFTGYFYEGLSLIEIGVRAGASPSRISRMLYEMDAHLEAAGQPGTPADSIALESPIENLGLSSRAQNAIHRLGCVTVRDLLGLDLSTVRGVGRKTRREVWAALRSSGLPHPEADARLESELRGLDTSLERMHARVGEALELLAREIGLVQKRIRKRMQTQTSLPSAESPGPDRQPVL